MEAFLRSMQAKNEDLSEGDGQKVVVVVENNETQQIDSSDEYDSTQDIHGAQTTGQTAQLSSLDSPDTVATVSRPNSSSAIARNTILTSPSSAFPLSSNISDQVTAQDHLIPSQLKMPIQAPMSATRASIPGSQKVRLPNDLIGILEDRIKEDGKGDVDAWLSLIDEYKRRGKSNDVRSVYERFLKAFPLTVSCWVMDHGIFLIVSLRQNNGLPLSNSKMKLVIDKE